jgi:hypothetical protein
MLHRLWFHTTIAGLSGIWLSFAVVNGAHAEEATAPQPTSSAAAQAGATAVRNFTEFLKFEAERAELATKHDSEVIERALEHFKWLVQVAGAFLLAGGALLSSAIAWANYTSKTEIRREVTSRLGARITEEIGSQIRSRMKQLDQVIEAGRVNTERRFTEQQNLITRLQHITARLDQQQDYIKTLAEMSVGLFPYTWLKVIYNKIVTAHP